MGRTALGVALVAALALPILPSSTGATTITILNMDGAGEGFNDPTPVAPVGGNPGTTLGAQRLNVFQYAAGIWAGALTSSVEIRVRATFDPLTCTMSSAVLGFGGPLGFYRDFAGAPLTGTWYPAALASALAGTDIDVLYDDIQVMFNSAVGGGGGCPFDFYYGLDATPPAPLPGHAISDLASVVIHELGHGLGFGSLISLADGTKALGFDDAYEVNVENHSTGILFPVMTDPQRLAALTNTGNLHWAGPAVVAASGFLTAGRDTGTGHVLLYAPGTIELGSTLSHFDNSLFPNQVLEAYYAGPNHSLGLARQVMQDMGWNVSCGNGAIDAGEQCDDNNNTPGDGCNGACVIEACYTCAGAPSTCTPITACIGGDGCCPTGCTLGTDSDCTPPIPALTPGGWLMLAALLTLAMRWALRRRFAMR
jgi:cysteine-rich repeat protein